jgi:putative ABC transport system permease protein
VSGVAWAVPLYRAPDGQNWRTGRSSKSFSWASTTPPHRGARDLLVGDVTGLDLPGGFLIDQNGYHLLWPGETYRTGQILEVNGRRSVLVGVCTGTPKFQTPPIVSCPQPRRGNAPGGGEDRVGGSGAEYAGRDRRGTVPRVQAETDLLAMTRREFAWRTMWYYLEHTGLLLNFGTTVSLGFVVGVSIAGQNFYSFTVENLRFATLKAMGATDRTLAGMVLLQAVTVGLLGYALGVGLAAAFGELVQFHTKLVFYMPWQVLVGTGVAVVLVVMLASLLSLRRVLRVEPAAAFR